MAFLRGGPSGADARIQNPSVIGLPRLIAAPSCTLAAAICFATPCLALPMRAVVTDLRTLTNCARPLSPNSMCNAVRIGFLHCAKTTDLMPLHKALHATMPPVRTFHTDLPMAPTCTVV